MEGNVLLIVLQVIQSYKMMQHATYWGGWWKIQDATYVCVGTYPLEGAEERKTPS